MRVLVTGGSGILGMAAIPRLVGAGFQVRALSRDEHHDRAVEWVSGSDADLAAAVEGTQAVLHLSPRGAAGVVDAAGRAGVAHLLLVSAVGAGRAPAGGLARRRAAEQLVTGSDLGWTILRATPFHQYLDGLLWRLPVLPADRSLTWQPVDAREVAERLVALLAAGPGMTVEEYGGPELLPTDDLIAQWLRARRKRRPVLAIRHPGRLAAAQRAGRLATGSRKGRVTWREYLSPAKHEDEPDFAEEHAGPRIAMPGAKDRVYGQDEGYEPQTRV